MGRRGGAVSGSKRRRAGDGGSDDSDEDYVVGDESAEESNCSSLIPSEEDDGSGAFSDMCDGFDEETEFGKPKAKWQKGQYRKGKSKPKISKRKPGASRAACIVDVADDLAGDENIEDDTDDEEFIPDDDDSFDDDEDDDGDCDWQKLRARGPVMGKKTSTKKIQKKRKSKVPKKARKIRRRLASRKIVSSDEDFDFIEEKEPKKTTKKKTLRKKRTIQDSDSDSGTGHPGYEYTVSEEERDFLKEAQSNMNLISARLRSASSQNVVEIGGGLKTRQHVPLGKKDKLQIEELQVDMGKQVCGICLSEEHDRVVRGRLNCCSHYFCFTCIMEWSKVESRCPLCKQRFVTISKEAESDLGISLRKTVIKIPRRDQVYRPSEEEIMSFLNPYDNVVCIECQQGGDDELMLLCDICDSPAHTYCVGLGREVPEGNWYCEACRASHRDSTTLPPQSMLDQSRRENTASTGSADGRRPVGVFDLNIPYERTPQESQEQHFSRDSFFSSGNPVREALDAASPISSTVSGRRRLRFRIHNLLSANMMNSISEVPNSNLASNVSNGAVSNGSDFASIRDSLNLTWSIDGGSHRMDISSFPQETSDLACENSSCLWKEENNGSVETLSNGLNCERLKMTSGRVYPASTISRTDPRNSSNSNFIFRHNLYANTVECDVLLDEGIKKQIQFLVKSHMERISKDFNLDYNNFKEIARRSTHTILAAGGFDHQRSVIIPIDPPRCAHSEIVYDQSTRILKDCCSNCFNSFVKDVVLRTAKLKAQ